MTAPRLELDPHDRIYDEARTRVRGPDLAPADATNTRGPRGVFRPTLRQEAADVARQVPRGLAEAGIVLAETPGFVGRLLRAVTPASTQTAALRGLGGLLERAAAPLTRGAQETRTAMDEFYGRPTTPLGQGAQLLAGLVGGAALEGAGDVLARGARAGTRVLGRQPTRAELQRAADLVDNLDPEVVDLVNNPETYDQYRARIDAEFLADEARKADEYDRYLMDKFGAAPDEPAYPDVLSGGERVPASLDEFLADPWGFDSPEVAGDRIPPDLLRDMEDRVMRRSRDQAAINKLLEEDPEGQVAKAAREIMRQLGMDPPNPMGPLPPSTRLGAGPKGDWDEYIDRIMNHRGLEPVGPSGQLWEELAEPTQNDMIEMLLEDVRVATPDEFLGLPTRRELGGRPSTFDNLNQYYNQNPGKIPGMGEIEILDPGVPPSKDPNWFDTLDEFLADNAKDPIDSSKYEVAPPYRIEADMLDDLDLAELNLNRRRPFPDPGPHIDHVMEAWDNTRYPSWAPGNIGDRFDELIADVSTDPLRLLPWNLDRLGMYGPDSRLRPPIVPPDWWK